MQKKNLKIHFVSMEGNFIYNLATALHLNGHTITGSCDKLITSKRLLEQWGLLPEKPGWFPEKISKEIDSIIVGSHVEKDNPELKRAQELGLEVYSYPKYIYKYAKDKQRIVIAGSYGKTVISAIITHVLKYWNRKFDYVISSPTKGDEITVKLSDAPIIILEGSEYPTSSMDATPVFLHYRHNIGLISNIKWDHFNIYTDFDAYVRQFDAFADISPKGGTLIYCEEDALATVIGSKERPNVKSEKYRIHPYEYIEGQFYLTTPKEEKIPVQPFGQHYMRNIAGAKKVLRNIGITSEQFYEAIASFQGVHYALELVAQNHHTAIYKDGSAIPSQLKSSATTLYDAFPTRKLAACIELHSYCSLNKECIQEYADMMADVDSPIIYYNPESAKQAATITEAVIQQAFRQDDLQVFSNTTDLKNYLLHQSWENNNFLFMSAGDFNGLDIEGLANQLLATKK